MYFVEQNRVNVLIDIVFADSSPKDISDIKDKIDSIAREKAKFFNFSDFSGSLPLDSSMVLRILLEYYRTEKKAK